MGKTTADLDRLTVQNAKSSPLLRLPREIRDEILKYLLNGTFILRTERRCSKCREDAGYSQEYRTGFHFVPLPISNLLACKRCGVWDELFLVGCGHVPVNTLDQHTKCQQHKHLTPEPVQVQTLKVCRQLFAEGTDQLARSSFAYYTRMNPIRVLPNTQLQGLRRFKHVCLYSSNRFNPTTQLPLTHDLDYFLLKRRMITYYQCCTGLSAVGMNALFPNLKEITVLIAQAADFASDPKAWPLSEEFKYLRELRMGVSAPFRFKASLVKHWNVSDGTDDSVGRDDEMAAKDSVSIESIKEQEELDALEASLEERMNQALDDEEESKELRFL